MAFLSQFAAWNALQQRHITNQRFTVVGIQIVDHKNPAGVRIRVDGVMDMPAEIPSVRVGPSVGEITWPATTSQLQIRQVVPWR